MLPYQYNVQSVTRDGEREPYQTTVDGNAFRVIIGDEDVFLTYGRHTYVIKYEVKNQIRYFDDHDELYWNITGNYWAFPIEEASARITLPNRAEVTGKSGYTGGFGEAGHDYAYRQDGDTYVFETMRPMEAGEGLTASLNIAKGAIAPLSAGDKSMLWWFRYGALAVLVASFCGVFGFLLSSFRKVGQDPPKPPVFPAMSRPKACRRPVRTTSIIAVCGDTMP